MILRSQEERLRTEALEDFDGNPNEVVNLVLINGNVPQQSRNYRQLEKDQICLKQDQEHMSISSLLSLLPLSCMVVPIETDCPRGHSAFPSFNSSRGTSANSTAYSMDYADCIQAQANNLT